MPAAPPPSVQAVPLACGGLVEQVPVEVHAPAVWQESEAGQLVVPEQTPAIQLSPVVQAMPSLQVPPLFGVWVQPPEPQASVVQGLPSSHAFAADLHVPPVQVPPHTPEPVHAVPSATLAVTQPLTESQVTDWQGLVVLHTSAVPIVHTPPLQVSVPSHTVPSLQLVPSAMLVTAEQSPPAQVLALWQALPDGQVVVVAGMQTPAALQVRGLVAFVPEQLPAAPHVEPLAFTAQVPAPVPVAVHWPERQLGLLAESPAQAVWQQMLPPPVPATHALLAQSVLMPHFCPLATVVPQVLRIVLHLTPALQSASVVQLVLQLAPLQT